ncbi:MAG: flippase [Candidatus Staskawiczbacteria bacterium]|nr:flippase [Candidatus Staskawiczbacteria bacterium]
MVQNRHKQTILKNAFWLATTTVFSKGAVFVAFMLIAGRFGPEIFGKWNFALSFVSIFVILVDFGFSALAMREIARDKIKSFNYVNNILAMKLILSFVAFAVVFFTINFLSKDVTVLKLAYLLAFYVFINNFTVFFQSIFRAHEKMQFETGCQVVQNLCLLGLSAFFISSNASILTISYAFIGSASLGFLLSIVFVLKYFSKIDLKVNLDICKKILKKSLPFLFAGIFYMIYFRIGSVMLGMLSGMEEVGHYNAAYNLFIATLIIPEIITMGFFPRLSHFYYKNRLELKQIFISFISIMIFSGIFLSIVLFFLSKFIILNIYSAQYYNSVILLRVLSLIVVVKFLSYAYSWFLVSVDEQKQVLKIQGLAAVLNIILSYIFIIKYNSLGAVIAIIITELFLLCFFYLSSRKKWAKIHKLNNLQHEPEAISFCYNSYARREGKVS